MLIIIVIIVTIVTIIRIIIIITLHFLFFFFFFEGRGGWDSPPNQQPTDRRPDNSLKRKNNMNPAHRRVRNGRRTRIHDGSRRLRHELHHLEPARIPGGSGDGLQSRGMVTLLLLVLLYFCRLCCSGHHVLFCILS